ncbi:aspartyl-phosphate phosphatase Spo0E family protein [Paenibacillus silvae]|uniref:aspartyl-phosphate phosphatase Spo0E family protein n=1 Tax=Paenibacillus silvae TaxID=1325358 RepID=UPI0025A2F726|nr:aspartyl-phosphate phosphatase Spo0E family protein [Paenibacillus silvae]MDM5280912.1 aspartyl-phosphate phosphatase Spo0E family protein [Paenibacillus silvae]
MKRSTLIQLEIEQARSRLHEIANQYNGLLHPELIKQSVILDKLINQFYDKNGTKNKAD